ncbi:hypothetical protein I5384_03160 [Citrobacter koseri]|uniref:hypothetical protein n=1 Tax=Citrobacter koseri TaxID=545 RepID=UPI001900FBCD|nr:hypothetical protein [Citrobacter koseri]MBJ8762881.1 hypothetical protein [Citrobacter koseri]MBJ9102007.1 hypothetical protein [Citrobacter koseri]HEM6680851.1 hypothetical protein [Citrobacter koseri]HEM6809068.1 hypothetical protein [Citrobacter koseri]
MNKYEGVTVVCLTKNDYNGDELKPVARRAVDTADIVTDTGLVIKNRVADSSEEKPLAKKNVPPVIEGYVFDALLAVRKLEALAQITHESFFKAEDEEDQLCSMFSIIWDYANEVGSAIRNIKQEIK